MDRIEVLTAHSLSLLPTPSGGGSTGGTLPASNSGGFGGGADPLDGGDLAPVHGGGQQAARVGGGAVH